MILSFNWTTDAYLSGRKTCTRRRWADNVWPNKWTGDEVDGTALVPLILGDGISQPTLEAFTVD